MDRLFRLVDALLARRVSIMDWTRLPLQAESKEARLIRIVGRSGVARFVR